MFLRFVPSGCNLKPSKFIPIIARGFSIPKAPVGASNALLCHPTYWASDASHVVPCAAGDAIQWWKDAVTGTWYQQSTSGSRLIARQDVTGKWYAEGTGTQQHPWIDLSGQSATNATFAVAYRTYSSVNYAMFISSQSIREIGYDANSNALKPRALLNGGSAIIASTADSLNTDYRVIATFGNPNTTLYRNGSSVATTSSDGTTGNMSASTAIFGRVGTSAYCQNGRFYGGAIFLSNSVNVSSLDATLHGYCTS